MKLSTRTRYGTRLMLRLADNYNKDLIQLKVIAKKEKISMKYLSIIVIALKQADLINAQRGKNGGYYLSRDPKKITMREIIEATEGKIAIVGCVNSVKKCKHESNCITFELWKKMNDSLINTVKKTTLHDLIQIGKKKNKEVMYFI